MKKILTAAAVGLLVAGSVAAQESTWLVRVRAVNWPIWIKPIWVQI
jgi:outer membrane protein